MTEIIWDFIFASHPGLPIPLNLSYFWRILISISLLITLVIGGKYRRIILSYINSPETNIGPINYLIWVDQMNGFLLAIIIIARIVFLLSPVPLSSVFGFNFCNAVFSISVFYTGGGYMWGCCIAVFRVMFIKAQTFLKIYIGTSSLLFFMLVFGTVLDICYSISLFFSGDRSPTVSMCTYDLEENTKTASTYQVFFKLTN
jgi:hypothetical protein